MSKIIKEGDLQTDWKTSKKCTKAKYGSPDDLPPCGAEFEVEENDLLLYYWKGNYGGYHYYPAAKCPCCGKINSIMKTPNRVWDRLCARTKGDGIWDGWQDK